MEFAKLRSAATYNLATSGVLSYPLAKLPLRIEDLEIDGDTLYGYAPLQQRLAGKNGVSPESVVAATGTSLANHLAMAASFEPGDEVLIEEPTYELLLRTAEYLGATIRRFPRRFENQFQIDPSDVARQLSPRTRLIVITNLHNPSGALTSTETLLALGAIARDSGARILVDEVYLETSFDQPIPSAFHLGPQFIATSSLTKAYGLSGIRCGWILAEPELAHRIWRINDLYAASPVHPAELISVIALDHLGHARARARSLLSANWQALRRFFDSRSDLDFFLPSFGTTVFPRLRAGSVDQLFDLLTARYDTSFVPGRFFEMPQHFRLGLGGDVDMTEQALLRLAHALDGK
jgi:aspartate/methionine/tyrosine aminotransferase